MFVYIMFNNRKSESQSQTQYAMNKMSEVETPQGHKPRIPQIPQREHLRERPTKVGPHFAQDTTHTPRPSSPPAQKTLKITPLPTPAARIRSPYCHVSITHTKNHPLPALLSHPRTRSWPNVATQCHSTVFILAHPVPMTSS